MPLTNNGFVDEYHDVNNIALVPIIVMAQPAANKMIELEVFFTTMDNGTLRWSQPRPTLPARRTLPVFEPGP